MLIFLKTHSSRLYLFIPFVGKVSILKSYVYHEANKSILQLSKQCTWKTVDGTKGHLLYLTTCQDSVMIIGSHPIRQYNKNTLRIDKLYQNAKEMHLFVQFIRV